MKPVLILAWALVWAAPFQAYSRNTSPSHILIPVEMTQFSLQQTLNNEDEVSKAYLPERPYQARLKVKIGEKSPEFFFAAWRFQLDTERCSGLDSSSCDIEITLFRKIDAYWKQIDPKPTRLLLQGHLRLQNQRNPQSAPLWLWEGETQEIFYKTALGQPLARIRAG